jgi:hypothetical protein
VPFYDAVILMLVVWECISLSKISLCAKDLDKRMRHRSQRYTKSCKSRSRYATNGYVSEPIRLSNIATKAHKEITARRRCSQSHNSINFGGEIVHDGPIQAFSVDIQLQTDAPQRATSCLASKFERDWQRDNRFAGPFDRSILPSR